MERGVGDLDPSARRVLDALATGSHLFIDAPVGADSTGAVAAVVAEAAAIGRSVLYVPGHRRAADKRHEERAGNDLPTTGHTSSRVCNPGPLCLFSPHAPAARGRT